MTTVLYVNVALCIDTEGEMSVSMCHLPLIGWSGSPVAFTGGFFHIRPVCPLGGLTGEPIHCAT